MALMYRERLSCFGHSSNDAGGKVMPALSGTCTTSQELVASVVEVMHAAEVRCV